jgi:hypothetical protein
VTIVVSIFFYIVVFAAIFTAVYGIRAYLSLRKVRKMPIYEAEERIVECPEAIRSVTITYKSGTVIEINNYQKEVKPSKYLRFNR